MNFINYLIVKMLVKVKFANIINIAAKEEIIPELLQSKCNAKNIFESVSNFINNPSKMKAQINKTQLKQNDVSDSRPPACACIRLKPDLVWGYFGGIFRG